MNSLCVNEVNMERGEKINDGEMEEGRVISLMMRSPIGRVIREFENHEGLVISL